MFRNVLSFLGTYFKICIKIVKGNIWLKRNIKLVKLQNNNCGILTKQLNANIHIFFFGKVKEIF